MGDDYKKLLLTHRIKPEGAVWIRDGESLLFQAFSSVASLVLQFTGYALTPQGDPIIFDVRLTPTSDRLATEVVQQFGECFLLGVACSIVSGNANRGQCYVRVRAQRGSGSTVMPLMPLIQHYVNDNYSPVFPYSPQEDSLEGPGMLRSITGTDPAAGAEISETVPTGARWRLHSLVVTLVTDATVATRVPRLFLDSGSGIYAKYNGPSTQAASLTVAYQTGNLGEAVTGSGSAAHLPMPSDTRLAAGYTIDSATVNLQAGDNYGAPVMLVEEWLEA